MRLRGARRAVGDCVVPLLTFSAHAFTSSSDLA
jgi:hypothetical protein